MENKYYRTLNEGFMNTEHHVNTGHTTMNPTRHTSTTVALMCGTFVPHTDNEYGLLPLVIVCIQLIVLN